MLSVLVVLVVLLTFLGWGRQAVWSWRLALCYPPRTREDAPDTCWPEAVVVLPVRGADPALGDCLRGLCAQDYPSFTVHVVVDSEYDSAWECLRPVLASQPEQRLRVSVLRGPLTTCSLKVSSLLQAIQELPASCRVVAHVDADVVPPPHWLRSLVRPLLGPGTGAASGIRWYHPDSLGWGTLVRHVWGAGAAAQMLGTGIPWGGSLAVSADLARDPALQERWANSFVEDTSLPAYLREKGLRLAFVPAVTMINAETVSLAGCYRFIRRQMFSVWLHHPARWHVLVTGLAMSLAVPLALFVAAFAWSQGVPAGAVAATATALGMLLLAGLGLAWVDGYFYYTAPDDAPLRPLNWRHLPALALAMVLYPVALVSACRLREIDWRGVRYRVGPGRTVRRLGHPPWTERPADPARPQSVL